MRKRFFVLMALLTFGLLLVFSTVPTIAADPDFKGVTIKAITNAEAYSYSLKMAKDELKAKYNINLEVELTGLGGPEYTKQMVEFTSGSGTYDIVWLSPVWMADFSKYLEPLEPLAKKWNLDFELGDIADTFNKVYNSWDGVWYSVPYDGDVHIFYYNEIAFDTPAHKEKFKQKYGYDLHPPNTWKEYRDMAEFFTGWDWDGDGQVEYGGGECWKSGMYPYWWFNSRFASYGGVYFDEDMKPLINSPAGIKALRDMAACKPFYPPGIFTFGSPELKTALYKGDVAMAWHWTSTGKLIEDPKTSDVVGKFGFGVAPGVEYKGEVYRRPAFASGYGLAINKFSKNKDAAVHVVQFYNSPKISLKRVMDPQTAADPYRVSHFESEAFRSGMTDGGDYLDAIKETLPLAFPDLQIPGGKEYAEALSYEISKVLVGEKQPKQALDAAAKKWNRITRRFGKDKQKALWNQQYNAMKSIGIVYRPEIAEAAK